MKTRSIQVITLFPDMCDAIMGASMMWKAQKDGALEYRSVDLRQFGIGPRRQVDDMPFGGGDGMVLRPEPLFAAVRHALEHAPESKVVLLTPRGRRWEQSLAASHADSGEDLIFVCGRYEGFDERITELVDYEYSIGDYVLTGGELPALVMIDSIVRLIPGVLGGETSAELESFSDGSTLEHPHYTRPAEFEGMKVPDVLLSGNHAAIEQWRNENSATADRT